MTAMHTPWGTSDSIETKAQGIYFVSTPSHGGFKVERPLLDKIPLAWRRASFNGQGMAGWFEEDCDWCMVALTFPERFSADELKAARATFDYWIAKKLA
jgi:hypothetical protein